MPESKTITIDEITSPKDGASSKKSGPVFGTSTKGSSKQTSKKASKNPLGALGWKALLVLKATQGFMFLRSKSYGKWLIIPAVILTTLAIIIIAIPLALIAIVWFILKTLLHPTKPR